jgi:hypothetical protein
MRLYGRPGSQDELHYLENKTKAYAQMIEAFIQFDQAIRHVQ